jgi:hypothetical protein
MDKKIIKIKEQPLFDKKLKSEDIRRQFSATYTVRTIYGETRKGKLAMEVESGNRKFIYNDEERKKAFLEKGITGLPKTKEDEKEIAMAMSRMRYGSSNTLLNDLGTGINTVLTRPRDKSKLYDVHHLYTKEGQIAKTNVTLSLSGMLKLALGPVVDDKGRAIHGANDIVKEKRKLLMKLITGSIPEPYAMASVNGTENLVFYGKPLVVDRVYRDAVTISLDNIFFPISECEESGELKMHDVLVHNVAGLSSVIDFGRYLLRQRKNRKNLPQTPQVHKAMIYMQTASEMIKFAPEIIHEQRNGVINFAFRRGNVVRDLRPQAINGIGGIYFNEFIEFLNNVGRISNEAMEELGIYHLLHDKTLIPLMEKSAQFPENKNIVYIKAETAKARKQRIEKEINKDS